MSIGFTPNLDELLRLPSPIADATTRLIVALGTKDVLLVARQHYGHILLSDLRKRGHAQDWEPYVAHKIREARNASRGRQQFEILDEVYLEILSRAYTSDCGADVTCSTGFRYFEYLEKDDQVLTVATMVSTGGFGRRPCRLDITIRQPNALNLGHAISALICSNTLSAAEIDQITASISGYATGIVEHGTPKLLAP